jgi:Arc/MetJ-type ribon-helix-helix transcriptional regulator
MSTLSIPLPNEMAKAIDDLVKKGVASNKADLVRRALKQYIEDQVVQGILKAAGEPRLKGDLDELAKKFS